MRHEQRLETAILVTDDRYPHFVLICPFPSFFIPALKTDLVVQPLIGPSGEGDIGIARWFASEQAAWEWLIAANPHLHEDNP